MSTKLLLTRNSPLRTVLVNHETYQPLYQIDTPRGCFTRNKTTRITHASADAAKIDFPDDETIAEDGEDDDAPTSEKKRASSLKSEETAVEDIEVSLATDTNELARIHWKLFAHNQIVFKGQIQNRADMLPKSGSGFEFDAKGRKFKWILGVVGVSTPKLILDDGSGTQELIAKFHPQRVIRKKQRAHLEVTTMGMEILDEIVLSFVFVEKKRRDRLKRMRNAAIAGGASGGG